jgi:Flp pilus assembly protein TadG
MTRTKSRLRDFILGFATRRDGVSAIEFGLIVPVLATIVLGLTDVAAISTGVGEMQTAARAAIQYAMNGGTDMTAAQTRGTNAWQSKPSDGTLTASSACYCGSSTSDCQTVCSDKTYPKKLVTVTASGTYGTNFMTKKETVSEVLRIR